MASKLRIDEVHGEVKPAHKLALVDKLHREGRIVAMADDGINDAPVLAKWKAIFATVSDRQRSQPSSARMTWIKW